VIILHYVLLFLHQLLKNTDHFKQPAGSVIIWKLIQYVLLNQVEFKQKEMKNEHGTTVVKELRI
jgi:hypothetical protein